MNRYGVHLKLTRTVTFTVEAETEQEAFENAENIARTSALERGFAVEAEAVFCEPHTGAPK